MGIRSVLVFHGPRLSHHGRAFSRCMGEGRCRVLDPQADFPYAIPVFSDKIPDLVLGDDRRGEDKQQVVLLQQVGYPVLDTRFGPQVALDPKSEKMCVEMGAVLGITHVVVNKIETADVC